MNEKKFIEEVTRLGIIPSEQQLSKLYTFYELLIEWNTKINLTRIVEKEEVYLKHFYDSLTLYSVVDLNKISTLCDVGTGAGFPGIVLKIFFPNLKVTLVDSLQKRVNYLKEIIIKLELEDIEVYHSRAEYFCKENREKFDIVTARAVAELRILCEICIPMVKKQGYFISMKANIEEELEDSKNVIKLLKSEIENIKEFELPIEKSKRTLILIKKNEETDIKYPRIIEKIKKIRL